MPELTVEEGGAELLDVVRPLWLSMFEWHRSLPPEASSAVAAAAGRPRRWSAASSAFAASWARAG